MLGLDAQFKLLAAVVGIAFGLVVLMAGRRRPAHWALAAFFFLIALNQGAEAARATGLNWLSPTGWQRLAALSASLDPFALFYFAAFYPERGPLSSRRWIGAMGATAAVLALWSGWLYVDPYPPVPRPAYQFVFPSALGAFTVVAYSAFLVHALRLVERGGGSRGVLLVLAAGVATFRPVGYLTQELARMQYYLRGIYLVHDRGPLAYVLLDIGAVVAFYLLLARRFPSGRRPMVVGAALALLLNSVQLVEYLAPSSGIYYASRPFGHGSAAIRFLLFGAFISMAIIRHDVLGATLRDRRVAARVLIVLATITIGALALGPFVGTGIPPWALAAIAAAVVLSQGFQKLIDHAAWRLFAVPPPKDEQARVNAYRAALQQAVAEGRRGDDPMLAKLREDLEVDSSVAEVLAEAAERDRGPIRLGDVLASRYEVKRALGAGTGGRVFLARDERLGRDVVLKEVASGPGQATEIAMREARVAGEASHPNVVTLFDVLSRTRTLVLVTEYLPGGSLADRFATQGPLGPDDGLQLARGIIRGVAVIHALGVVHRDLKPANILLTSDGDPKIADFGLARLGADQVTHVGTSWTGAGTPAYMAPEQRRGAPATTRTDVYAIGLILRHSLREPVHPAVAGIIERALLEEPAARFADAAEMLAALDHAQRAQ